jgi:hypothetical protein
MTITKSFGTARVSKTDRPYLSYHIDFPATASKLKLEVRVKTDGQFMVGWFPGWVNQADVPELTQLMLIAEQIIKEEG